MPVKQLEPGAIILSIPKNVVNAVIRKLPAAIKYQVEHTNGRLTHGANHIAKGILTREDGIVQADNSGNKRIIVNLFPQRSRYLEP